MELTAYMQLKKNEIGASDIIISMEQDEFDVADTGTTNKVTYCSVFNNKNELTSKGVQIKTFEAFSRAIILSLKHWRSSREEYSSN